MAGNDGYPDVRRYRFGTATFDEKLNELHVDGRPVRITVKPARLLRMLLRHYGQLVTRDQLRQAVWHSLNVTDDAINTTISRVNDCLGPANAACIAVRPGIGYCLNAPVEWEIVGIPVTSQNLLEVEHAAPPGDPRVRSLLRFITNNLIAPADPAVTGRTNTEIARLVRAAAGQIDASIEEDLPDIRAALHQQMQGLFSQLSEFDQAIAHGRAALKAATMCRPNDPVQIADIQLTLARDLIQRSENLEAQALIEATDRLIGTTAEAHGAPRVRLLLRRGQYAIGALATAEAVDYLTRAATLEATLPERDSDLGEQVAFELAQALWLANDHARAEPIARGLLARQIERFGAESARAAYSTVLLANILAFADRCDEAIALLEPAIDILSETLGPDDRRTVTGRAVLANIAFKQGHYGKAAAVWGALKDHFTRITGARSINALVNDQNIALALKRSKKVAEAETIFRETLAAARQVFGEDAPSPQLLKYELADILLDRRKTDEAELLLAGLEADRLKQAKIQDDWPAALLYQTGRIAWHRGDLPRALRLLEQAADMLAACRDRGPIGEADVRALIALIRQEMDAKA